MTSSDTKKPAHIQIYQLVRDMILFGELTPGEAVTIQGLTEVLGSGVTPVREAIRRLITEGALEFQGNRRVSVPVLTVSQIDELAFARLAIEPKLAYWATENITPSKVCELDVIDQAINSAVDYGNIKEYLIQNHRFHMTIYQAALKPELLSITERLWLRIGPSMRVICGRLGTHNFLPDMHQAAIAAMRENRPQDAEEAMRQDLLQGVENVRQSALEGSENG